MRSRQELTQVKLNPWGTRQVLRDPAARFQVTVPRDAVLLVNFAIDDSAWQRGLEEMEFTVSFQSGSERLDLFRRRLTANDRKDWQEATIPLATAAGRQGTIALQTTVVRGTPPATGEILWSAPVVEPARPADGPNIILVSIDTLRADHLGCYGSPRDTSPNIDRLARDGIRFRQAIAASSWTIPSTASMLTGLTPSRHGAIKVHAGAVADDYPTLAELLWDVGYDTAAFTEGGFLLPGFGFARGFDRYDAPSRGNGMLERNLEETKHWIDQHQNRRFFLFFHTYAVHIPYAPPPPYDTMFDPGYQGPFAKAFTRDDQTAHLQGDDLPMPVVRHLEALYDGGIRYLDARFEGLREHLESTGLASRTCIILTSDHGEEFREHGNLYHQHAKLFEELVRVPLIVWCPQRFAGGRVIEEPVSGTDITPTILDLVGAAIPGELDGISFAPTLRGQNPAAGRITVSEVDGSWEKREGTVVALRTTAHKFVRTPWKLPPALYDLVNDPRETRDVGGEQGDVLGRLADVFQSTVLPRQQLQAAKPQPTPGGQALDEAALERLRALGYQP